jgi:hypothetical protein
MAKHIPGPFVVESVNSDYPHDICLGYDIPGEGRPILIAAVFHDEDDDSPISAVQASATARFFAASDDLEEGMARFILLAHSGMIGGVPPDIHELPLRLPARQSRRLRERSHPMSETIRQWAERYLYERGMFPDQAKTVIDAAEVNTENKPMEGR